MTRFQLPGCLLFFFSLLSCNSGGPPRYDSFEEYPTDEDANLWVQYSPQQTTFTIWSPIAEEIQLHLYPDGDQSKASKSLALEKGKKGVWQKIVEGDLNGTYYTYQVKTNGHWLKETPGIYATAVGVNGLRAMVLDMETTNPTDWAADKGPALNSPNDAILYELHVRDMTIHPSSGSSSPGKYMGLTEGGTKGPEGVATAIDHMKELGITHVHLLPSYDHYSIDESRLDTAQYNWGYDPQNYNVPEGSFASDPFKAEVRIREFKQMVKAFHDAGIGVILDVVYNHTGRTEESNFNQELPGYYYRQKEDGSWSDASACGNETASERAMVRKFIKESVLHWAKEYHLDGFRFDLMGIHDIKTMNQVTATLKEFNPDILIYGEGWTAGDSPLPEKDRALKKHAHLMPHLSVFSDDIRDGLKGSVFDEKDRGFASGKAEMEASVRFGVVGSIQHDQIDYGAVNYSNASWALNPWQAISYVSCHDNHTLFDKLRISMEGAGRKELIAMHKLANAIVLTSQGIPFLHAGVEMMRTKGGEHNSYNLPDAVNQIDWNWKVQNRAVFDYYQALIDLRKKHPAFRMINGNMVRKKLRFIDTEPGTVAYMISGNANRDTWREIYVCYNAQSTAVKIELEGKWQLAVLGDQVNEQGIKEISGSVDVPAVSMLIAFR